MVLLPLVERLGIGCVNWIGLVWALEDYRMDVEAEVDRMKGGVVKRVVDVLLILRDRMCWYDHREPWNGQIISDFV